MAETTLTVRQIIDLGLWEKVCDYKGWSYYILNEGRIMEDELVTFDSEFKKEEREFNDAGNNYVYGLFSNTGDGDEHLWNLGVCLTEEKAYELWENKLDYGAWIGEIEIK